MTQQRGSDEIRRDLALEVLHHGDLCMDFAGDRLIGDVAPLLARVSDLEQERDELREQYKIAAPYCSMYYDWRARAELAEARNREQERWIDEAVLALDAASVIGARSCREGDGLHLSNHDRLIREAREWSSYARYSTHSIEPLPRAAPAAKLSGLSL